MALRNREEDELLQPCPYIRLVSILTMSKGTAAMEDSSSVSEALGACDACAVLMLITFETKLREVAPICMADKRYGGWSLQGIELMPAHK